MQPRMLLIATKYHLECEGQDAEESVVPSGKNRVSRPTWRENPRQKRGEDVSAGSPAKDYFQACKTLDGSGN